MAVDPKRVTQIEIWREGTGWVAVLTIQSRQGSYSRKSPYETTRQMLADLAKQITEVEAP